MIEVEDATVLTHIVCLYTIVIILGGLVAVSND